MPVKRPLSGMQNCELAGTTTFRLYVIVVGRMYLNGPSDISINHCLDLVRRDVTMSDPTLDDLISLNQEISAFVKSGIPLELGLKGLSGSVDSRLGKLSDRLATRMADGRNLSDALADEGPAISPVYLAVIEAGLASGKLPDALESLTASTQVIQEIRRRMFLALLYPMLCLFVAYLMLCLFLSVIAPQVINTVESFATSWPVEFLRILVRNRDYLTMVIPSVALTIVVVVTLLRRTVMGGRCGRFFLFRWVTGRSLDWAQFMEILSLQVEHGTPLAQAFVLAADSTEDRRLHRDARKVSEELTRGNSLATSLQTVKSLPPLVRWMLATGEMQGTLAYTLRQLCEIYRRRALRRSQIMKIWIPVAMTIVFTTLIGTTYGLAFFIPLRSFLLELMQG